MSDRAIEFDNVSKSYRGARNYRALRDDVRAVGRRLTRREGANERPAAIHALRDVSFEIERGSATALVGLNGAGKTTALRLMCRIAYPSEGSVRVWGRVGALMEVGTGMHPELTGRENVQLYGRMLGHKSAEIRRRFDAIVDFAGLPAAMDQPVKQYSSGMQLRLGFSIAAHLEPDVLLVDEAIAVGDAGFQYRCVERMGELVRTGVTIVFVSHDMSAVETLCDRVILLDQGQIRADGSARDVVASYLREVHASRLEADPKAGAGGAYGFEILKVSLHDATGAEVASVPTGASVTIRFHYRAARDVVKPIFSVGIGDGRIGVFALASMLFDGEAPEVLRGEGQLDCTFESLPLFPRTYEIWASVRGSSGFGDLVDWQRFRMLGVEGEIGGSGIGAAAHSLEDAPVKLPYTWRTGGDGA